MRRNFNAALIAISLSIASTAPVWAWGSVYMNDGFGENVVVKNGLFGRKTEVVKDRLGDGFASHRGFFGTREQDVNVLGNSFQRKKGLFGTSTIQGSSIFGDRIQTKRGLLGYRTTYVDVSGGANAVRALWNANKAKLGFGSSTPVTTPIGGEVPPAGEPLAPIAPVQTQPATP